jgi:hypothetical protein
MAHETFKQFRDDLEPHYDELDVLVDKIVNSGKVSASQSKYFEACRFKVKVLWYISQKIESLDRQYREHISAYTGSEDLSDLKLHKIEDRQSDFYIYYPFFEALEFENLLSQGKSCLDCFAKAVGSLYRESPNNIDTLSRVLRENHLDETTKQLLDFIDESKRLHGVIIDPNKGGKKSIRDLIAHRERIDIFFVIRKDAAGKIASISEGALLNMRHCEFMRFPNYLVRDVSSKVWFLALGIVQNCFKVLAQSI